MNHNRPAMLATARSPQHNFHWQHNAIAGFRDLAARDSVEKKAGCHAPHFLRRLTDDGKWRRTEFGQVEVIETGKGQIIRHFHAEAKKSGENIARGQRI